MSFHSMFLRWSALDDQKLRVFKDFYHSLSMDERQKLYECVKAVNELSPFERQERMQFLEEIGCARNRWIAVRFECELHEMELSASIPPDLLQAAIEAWNNNEEFVPPSLS